MKKFFAVFISTSFLFAFFSCTTTTGIPIPGEKARISKNIASEYYQIAEGYVGIKNYSKAAEYYKLALRDKNLKLQAYYKMGRCYALAKNWAEAEPIFKNLLKRDSENIDLKLSLAYIYAMQGENKKAMDYYTKLKTENPTNQTIAENYMTLSIAIQEDAENSKTKNSPPQPTEETTGNTEVQEEKEISKDLEALKNDFFEFKELFPDSPKLAEFQGKVEKLIPSAFTQTSEEENVSKDGETAPLESASTES